MALGNEIVIGTSINNTMGITGRSYDLLQLLHAAREAEAMGFDAVWVHDAPRRAPHDGGLLPDRRADRGGGADRPDQALHRHP